MNRAFYSARQDRARSLDGVDPEVAHASRDRPRQPAQRAHRGTARGRDRPVAGRNHHRPDARRRRAGNRPRGTDVRRQEGQATSERDLRPCRTVRRAARGDARAHRTRAPPARALPDPARARRAGARLHSRRPRGGTRARPGVRGLPSADPLGCGVLHVAPRLQAQSPLNQRPRHRPGAAHHPGRRLGGAHDHPGHELGGGTLPRCHRLAARCRGRDRRHEPHRRAAHRDHRCWRAKAW